jgi:peptidoglycan-N-acetylglucosamine deacetylase
MDYGRVRLAVLLILALAMLAEPAGASLLPVARGINPSRAGPPVTGAQAQPAQPANSAPGAPAPGESQRPNQGPTPAGVGNTTVSPSAGSGPPRSRFGPAGALRRTGSETVALTFDDGPDPVHTPQMLDLLAQHGVKATFCLVGFRARDNPDLVRRIAAEGHSLCNHSWQHLLDLGVRPPLEIGKDLADTNAAIRAAVPGASIRYFRAPGGNFTPALVAVARVQGMTSIYWEVDPRDWDHDNNPDDVHVARVVAEVEKRTRPGAIVLSHDNRQPTTITAYRTLLPWLTARFRLAALPA